MIYYVLFLLLIISIGKAHCQKLVYGDIKAKDCSISNQSMDSWLNIFIKTIGKPDSIINFIDYDFKKARFYTITKIIFLLKTINLSLLRFLIKGFLFQI